MRRLFNYNVVDLIHSPATVLFSMLKKKKQTNKQHLLYALSSTSVIAWEGRVGNLICNFEWFLRRLICSLQGELLCTRLRCPSANNSYTNYHEVISKEVLHNSTKSNRNYGRIRGTDPCLECDYELISPVCGPNWITYRSMCHALQCGGHSMERVYQGACKHVVRELSSASRTNHK